MVDELADALGVEQPLHLDGFVVIQTRDEHALLSRGVQACGNAGDLRCRLTRAVDHLRHALAQPALQIHLGVSQILERRRLQLDQRIIRCDLA